MAPALAADHGATTGVAKSAECLQTTRDHIHSRAESLFLSEPHPWQSPGGPDLLQIQETALRNKLGTRLEKLGFVERLGHPIWGLGGEMRGGQRWYLGTNFLVLSPPGESLLDPT